ncbi:MAG: hypothetical protein Roseis3KO_32490 [Roseivirga sp.]
MLYLLINFTSFTFSHTRPCPLKGQPALNSSSALVSLQGFKGCAMAKTLSLTAMADKASSKGENGYF